MLSKLNICKNVVVIFTYCTIQYLYLYLINLLLLIMQQKIYKYSCKISIKLNIHMTSSKKI